MISVEPRSTMVQCGRDGSHATMSFSCGGGNGCDAWEREPGIDDDDWDRQASRGSRRTCWDRR